MEVHTDKEVLSIFLLGLKGSWKTFDTLVPNGSKLKTVLLVKSTLTATVGSLIKQFILGKPGHLYLYFFSVCEGF